MITISMQAVRDQRGAVAVELTLLVPALLLVVGLLVAGGRLWFARTTVNEAAHTAARAASLARSAGEASTAGRAAGSQSLTTAGLRCRSTSVSINTAAFGVPAGTPSTVTSTVSCIVDFSDVFLPGWPGSTELTGRGSAALDTYRGR
ncbi:MAG TPA: TadE/TadG family type IV pilus assembly protein [Propionibacteriaceae bacterium]|nr:TadE/TadG family type IV pilus assembly protein [Propionibacteriaceae bacterium]